MDKITITPSELEEAKSQAVATLLGIRAKIDKEIVASLFELYLLGWKAGKSSPTQRTGCEVEA